MHPRIEIERILCPLDLSPLSETALSRAIHLAQVFRASVSVVHTVVEDGWTPAAEAAAGAAAAIEYLIAANGHAGVALETRILEAGDPASRICEFARSLNADLIVMGTHGLGGCRRLLLGSVAENVIRAAPCPVLTLDGAKPEPADGLPFHQIVCALDLTASSAHTLDVALSLAEGSRAHVTLLHLVEGLPGEAAAELLATPTLGAPGCDFRELAREQLHQLAVREGALGSFDTVVEFGTAWRGIVAEARRVRADLIVIGAHSRGPIASLFLGSTANHVVREAGCPVLVVRDRVAGCEAQRISA